MTQYVIKLKNNIKLENQIKEFLAPKYIFIPIRNPEKSKLLVSDNSYVYKNDLVIDGLEKHFSSISGRVLGVQNMTYTDGIFKSLVIENDFTESQRTRKGVKKRITDYSKLDGIKVLTKYGFNFNKVDYQCKTLIVNTLDLEPFFGNNYFILANHPKEILTATSSIGRFLNFDEIYLIMDNKNIDLISKYNDLISNYSPIQIKQVDNFYPEANNEMIKELLHLHQAAILNTREVYKAYHILKKNIPKNELLITITGEAVRNPNVVLVKKYSLLSEAFLQNNDFTSRMVDVYLNGFLSGEKINTLRYVIDENINGIIINKKEEKDIKKCSDCGLCAKYCPRKINPKVVMEKGGNVEAYIKERCIDCGICNFICPANINLKKYVK